MKRILAINGSPRSAGNTSFMLNSFLSGARQQESEIEVIDAHHIQLDYCNGCLRCNLIKRCSISTDSWPDLSQKILDSDILVFASPIYFHHVSASVKKILDRFRSFFNVVITEQSLKHQPWQEWNKDFVLLLSMGSSDDEDAKPVINLFEYMIKILGVNNRLHVITGNRLAVIKQVGFSKDELEKLYIKLNLSAELAAKDSQINRELLNKCQTLGKTITSKRY
jgi:multimeric flavodoxin WrbA